VQLESWLHIARTRCHCDLRGCLSVGGIGLVSFTFRCATLLPIFRKRRGNRRRWNGRRGFRRLGIFSASTFGIFGASTFGGCDILIPALSPYFARQGQERKSGQQAPRDE